MVSISSRLPSLSNCTEKLSNLKKCKTGIKAGGVMGALFCVPDFLGVPGAFKLKYNTDGEKVEGLNWKSGFKEIGKSTVKCLSYLAIPTAILGAAAAAGPAMAALAVAGSVGSTFALGPIFEKFLPEEKTVVAEACKKKGINFDQVA